MMRHAQRSAITNRAICPVMDFDRVLSVRRGLDSLLFYYGVTAAVLLVPKLTVGSLGPSGSVTTKVVPFGELVSRRSSPPWSSTIFCAAVKPNPVPFALPWV